tara:strand:- start:802 stop:1269 length:468 start_codon:yes stop_codon:yes gene_type:complete
MEEEDACPICLEALDASCETHALDCAHRFHSRCLIPWLRQGNVSCPACRGTAVDQLDGRTLYARASHMRVVARRTRAPADLKRLVDHVRAAEAREREAKRAAIAYDRAHREVLATSRKLRTKRYAAMRLASAHVRRLGVYASPEIPLPALVVRPW